MMQLNRLFFVQSRQRFRVTIDPRACWLSSSSSTSAGNINLQQCFDEDSTKFVSFLDEVDKRMAKYRSTEHFRTATKAGLHGNLSVNDSSKNSSLFWNILPRGNDSPIPPQVPVRSEAELAKAYDPDLFKQYKEAMDQHILSSPKFLKAAKSLVGYESVVEWLSCDFRQVEHSLSLLQNDETERTKPHSSSAFRTQLQNQREIFHSAYQFKPQHITLATAALTALSRYCAKRNQVLPLIVAWEKVKECGLVLSEEEASTFLYVFGNSTALYSTILLGSSNVGDLLMQNYGSLPTNRPSSVSEVLTGSSISSPSNSAMQQPSKGNIPAEVATYHDLLYKPTERSISIRVKALVAKGDAHGAQTLLESFPANDEARLRTYLPILKLYCEKGEVPAAFAVFQKMLSAPTVHLESENYVLLLATLAEHGYFRPDSPLIQGIADSIPSAKSNEDSYRGPMLFDFLLSQMADDVLEITSASARRLHNSLLQGFQNTNYAKSTTLIHSFTNMRYENELAKPNDLVVSRVAIDEKTAICPRTAVKLPLILLNDSQKAQLRSSVLKSSNEQHDSHVGAKLKTNLASDELISFANYLDSRPGQPFTVIVDGANVAYYMQNFDHGKFNWFQVQFMVDELLKKNENPLVIVPNKYCRPYFYNTTGSTSSKQILQPKEQKVINNLLQSGRLYRVPPSVYDDYHWILASISDQTQSRKGSDLNVPADNPEGRWPGTRPMIITNDQLNDLKIEMLEPRLFRRWFSSHIVNYTFTAFVDDECADDDICFSAADFFSREITRDGNNWHLPVSDWDLNDRLCIRLPKF